MNHPVTIAHIQARYIGRMPYLSAAPRHPRPRLARSTLVTRSGVQIARKPRTWVRVRIALGIWNLVLGVLLLALGY